MQPHQKQEKNQVTIELERHDRFQLQLTSIYPIDSKTSHLEYYLFVPPSLGCTAERYPAEFFYRDLRSFLRYRVNPQSLETLIKLPIFDELTQRIFNQQSLRFGLKLRRLGCEIKHAVAHWISLHPNPEREKIALFNTQLEFLLAKFRQLPIPEEGRIRRIFRQVDEYITHNLEYQLCRWLQEHSKLSSEHSSPIKQILIHEIEWRRLNNYPEIKSNGRNEQLLARIRLLRRFCESTLFLEIKRKREGRWMEQMVFSLAAGLAMAIAMAIAFMAQQEYGNLTLQFFNAMVVGYILKDRIKELTRNITWKRLNKNYFDFRTTILDGRKKKILGQIREQVRFPELEKIPDKIKMARNQQLPSAKEIGETLLLYRKQLQLKISKLPGGYQAIQDVQFLNLQQMISLTSEPIDELLTYDGQQVNSVEAKKSYQLWLITRTTNGEQHVNIWRITLTRKGIRQVKKFS